MVKQFFNSENTNNKKEAHEDLLGLYQSYGGLVCVPEATSPPATSLLHYSATSTATVSIYKVDTWFSSTFCMCWWSYSRNERKENCIMIFLCLQWKHNNLHDIGMLRMSSYHGVFADDSCGIPMVDINSSSIVILFRCSYGYIWTDKQRTNVFLWKFSIEMNEDVKDCMCLCVQKLS